MRRNTIAGVLCLGLAGPKSVLEPFPEVCCDRPRILIFAKHRVSFNCLLFDFHEDTLVLQGVPNVCIDAISLAHFQNIPHYLFELAFIGFHSHEFLYGSTVPAIGVNTPGAGVGRWY